MRLTASTRCGNPMQGKILGGHYQIISHLGGGGFGTTFIAEDRHLPGNPRCVVKQLKPKTADNALAWEAARRLFNREAEVLYQLGNHHQIPRLFAHFEQDQEFYLVQELIEGHELRQELAAVRQLNEVDVINILREILEILVFVHQQNVIHRDIKPANIIRRKQDGKLVLIDFGAVKQFSNQVIDSQGLSSMTIAVGSPGYMPNEQLAGKPRFSSDIYAVGMMGIQALTGLSPRQLPEDPKTCEIVWRDSIKISAELADVLDRMVRYDFRQRYQSASEALEAINSVSSIPLANSIQISPLAKNIEIHSLPTATIHSDELSSECGIDYTRLRDLLAAGKWKEADEETVAVMFNVVNKKQESNITLEDIKNFPCTDLRTIENLWVKYSNNRFGFRVQKRIYEELGGTINYEEKILVSLGDCIGWRVNGIWIYYDNFTFSINAPLGHFPAMIFLWIWPVLGRLFSRIDACKLNKFTDISPNVNLKIQPEENFDNQTEPELLAVFYDAEAWYQKGNNLYEKQQYQDALVAYEKAISKEHNHYLAWFMRGKTFNKCRCYEEEIACYEKAISIRPDYHKAWFMKSVVLSQLERDEQALASYNKAVEIQPKDFWAWRERGKILEKLERYQEAADSYHKAVLIKPDFRLAIDGRKRMLNKLRSTQSNNIKLVNDPENFQRREEDNQNKQILVKSRIAVVEGDIVRQRVDAIVNPTDEIFSGSGGVDHLIHNAAGFQLREACRQLKKCATGEVKITSGYNLSARWVIHTVGPFWRGGYYREGEILAQCYRNCLRLAEQYSIKTIAFPAISTGTFRFPIELASNIAVRTVKGFLEKNTSIERVVFVCFGEKSYDCYLTAVKEILG